MLSSGSGHDIVVCLISLNNSVTVDWSVFRNRITLAVIDRHNEHIYMEKVYGFTPVIGPRRLRTKISQENAVHHTSFPDYHWHPIIS